MKRVQDQVDMCIEQLPTLLELPEEPDEYPAANFVVQQLRSPASPRKSATKSATAGLSRLTAASHDVVPEAQKPNLFSFHVIKDCHRFNQVLCLARVILDQLKALLPRGVTCLPKKLLGYALLLDQDETPQEWLPSYLKGEKISLSKWIADITLKHAEMREILVNPPQRFRRGQDFKPDFIMHLSIFDDPTRIIYGLKHLRSIQLSCPVEEVKLCCRFIDPGNKYPLRSIIPSKCDLVAVRGLLLQNASLVAGADYNLQRPNLTEDYEVLPLVIIWADRKENEEAFQCPVYSNLNERRLLFHLPVNTNLSKSELLLFMPSICVSTCYCRGLNVVFAGIYVVIYVFIFIF
jgi:hypothetical protein